MDEAWNDLMTIQMSLQPPTTYENRHSFIEDILKARKKRQDDNNHGLPDYCNCGIIPTCPPGPPGPPGKAGEPGSKTLKLFYASGVARSGRR
jgi:hypothetical protein